MNQTKDDFVNLTGILVNASAADSLTHVVYPLKPWVLVCYTMLSVTGFVGNFMVLLVLLRNTHIRHSSFGVYIGGLAVIDSFVSLATAPAYLISTQWSSSPSLSSVTCKVIFGFNGLFYFIGVAAYLLLAMTWERYLLICKPLSSIAVVSAKKAKRVTAVILLGSIFIYGIYVMIIFFTPDKHTVGSPCKYLNYSEAIYALIFAVQYIVPISVMVFCLISILRELLRQNKNISTFESGIQNEALKRQIRIRKKTVVTIIWIIATYFVLWTPFLVLHLVYNLKLLDVELNSFFLQLSALLYFTTCSVNPVIYVLRSKMFRDGFTSTFVLRFGICSERNSHHYELTSIT